MNSTTRLLALVALGVWTLGVASSAVDIVGVWHEQQRSGELLIPLWLRLALLALVAVGPPAAIWAIVRTGTWIADTLRLRAS